jgi:hypothetical protein
MIALSQRLRELSRDEFESLVHQLLLSKFPGAGIKRPEGIGGDRGIDCFLGTLADGPAIWQSKHFPNGIKKSQRKQIQDSIKTVFNFYKPSRWTLCVPIDLRVNEHDWFQSDVIAKYKSCKIDLMGASEILHELIHNRPLRTAFFRDNEISNLMKVRQLATGTETASLEDRERLMVEMAHQFLEGNIDLEPRLTPVTTIGLARLPRGDLSSAGAVLSVTKGDTKIDFFPRDPVSYSLDPMQFSFTLGRTHSKRLESALNIGAPVKIPAGAILKLDSTSPLLQQLFGSQAHSQMEIEVRPLVPHELANREIPLRFVAGNQAGLVRELSYVPFKVERFGPRRITLLSSSRLPIEIRLELGPPSKPTANIRIRPIMANADVIDLAEVLEFLNALETGHLEIYSLDPAGPLFHEMTKFTNRISIPTRLQRAISDAALISKFFGSSLRLPDRVTETDFENIQTLRRIATGETFSGERISGNLVKDSSYKEQVMTVLDGTPISLRLDNPTGWQNVPLFGRIVSSGSVTMTADDVVFVDLDRTKHEYLDAAEGALIAWSADCRGSCRLIAAPHSNVVKSII